MAARSPESKEMEKGGATAAATRALLKDKAKRAAATAKIAEKRAREMVEWEKGKPEMSPALARVRRQMREKWLATQGQRAPASDDPKRLNLVKGPNKTVRA